MTVVAIPRYTTDDNASSASQTITASDTVNFPFVTRKIYVGGAGVVNVVYPSGLTQVFTCVAGGTLEVEAIRVNSTSTTATLMVAQF